MSNYFDNQAWCLYHCAVAQFQCNAILSLSIKLQADFWLSKEGHCKVRCTPPCFCSILWWGASKVKSCFSLVRGALCPRSKRSLLPTLLKGCQFIAASLGKLFFCWVKLWDLNLMYDIYPLQVFNACIFQTLEKHRVKSTQLNTLPNDSCSQFGSEPLFTVVVIFTGEAVKIDRP